MPAFGQFNHVLAADVISCGCSASTASRPSTDAQCVSESCSPSPYVMWPVTFAVFDDLYGNPCKSPSSTGNPATPSSGQLVSRDSRYSTIAGRSTTSVSHTAS